VSAVLFVVGGNDDHRARGDDAFCKRLLRLQKENSVKNNSKSIR
jgi:hypothetical protein